MTERSDVPRTETGKTLLAVVRLAVLSPEVATLLGADGKPQLVALISVDLLERDILAIEAEAAALKVTPRVEGSPVTRTTIVSRAASFMRVSADEIEASIRSMWSNGIMERDEAIVRATAEAVVAAMRLPIEAEAVALSDSARLREALDRIGSLAGAMAMTELPDGGSMRVSKRAMVEAFSVIYRITLSTLRAKKP